MQPYLPSGKNGFVRKDSADSGLSSLPNSRKASMLSNISVGSSNQLLSNLTEEDGEDSIKEDTPMETPDDDLCEKITQQVRNLALLSVSSLSAVARHCTLHCQLSWSDEDK
jgi:hypothetical protein